MPACRTTSLDGFRSSGSAHDIGGRARPETRRGSRRSPGLSRVRLPSEPGGTGTAGTCRCRRWVDVPCETPSYLLDGEHSCNARSFVPVANLRLLRFATSRCCSLWSVGRVAPTLGRCPMPALPWRNHRLRRRVSSIKPPELP